MWHGGEDGLGVGSEGSSREALLTLNENAPGRGNGQGQVPELGAAKDVPARGRGLSLPGFYSHTVGSKVGDPCQPPPPGSPQLGATSLALLRILPCVKPAPLSLGPGQWACPPPGPPG